MSQTEEALIDFIRLQLLEDPGFELGAEDELLLDDIVSSLGVMRLVAFIEERTALKIPAEDVVIENNFYYVVGEDFQLPDFPDRP